MCQVISKRRVLGKRIKQIREHRLMTQAALGQTIMVNKHAIYRIEKGLRWITDEELELLARALRCKMKDLRMDPAEADPPLVRATPMPRIRPKSWGGAMGNQRDNGTGAEPADGAPRLPARTPATENAAIDAPPVFAAASSQTSSRWRSWPRTRKLK
jgi:DNA-binding XRE family transcriptional regulator